MTFAVRERSRSRGEPVELYRVSGADQTVENMATSIAIGPGGGEYVYSTVKANRAGVALNYIPGTDTTFFEQSIADLAVTFPNVNHVYLTVAWHADDLRMGMCECRPRVSAEGDASSFAWRAGPATRDTAKLVHDTDENAGAPSDRSIYEAIRALIAAGYRVTLNPILRVELAADNEQPNPYGGDSQPPGAWRGLITCHPAPGMHNSPDKTAAAQAQVDQFFGTVGAGDFGWNASEKHVTYTGEQGEQGEWRYRRFILHMARLAKAADAHGFLIGSQLAGITSVRRSATDFPAILKLRQLANGARAILGADVKISYAADWTEYHSVRPSDNSRDILFALDPLWADNDIDFVTVDWFAPMSDWRQGDIHIDRTAGWGSVYQQEYLWKNIEGGEFYDWRYTGDTPRKNQKRTKVVDSYDEIWVRRQKDIRGWWSNNHRDRPAGVRDSSLTPWRAASKQVVFMMGVAPRDLATNEPRTGDTPFGLDVRDDAMQRSGIEAWLTYWQHRDPDNMVARTVLWFWDARPHPSYPETPSNRVPNRRAYANSHSLSGRTWAGYGFAGESFPTFGWTDAEQQIKRHGVTYVPVGCRRGNPPSSGTLDKASMEVELPYGTPIDDFFRIYPPNRGMSLTVYRGHYDEDPEDPACYRPVWSGRINGALYESPPRTVLQCTPLQAMFQNLGLARRYQLTCPHVLYGDECRANRAAATVDGTVASVKGTWVELAAAVPDTRQPEHYAGGLLEWRQDGRTEMRTIVGAKDRKTFRIRGSLHDLPEGKAVTLSLGCNRTQGNCRNLHSNILNFGGQPNIPVENPFGRKNQFY